MQFAKQRMPPTRSAGLRSTYEEYVGVEPEDSRYNEDIPMHLRPNSAAPESSTRYVSFCPIDDISGNK
jgi:hypothetical protein